MTWIIGHSRPRGLSVALSGGDAAFVDGASELFNGRPGATTAFTWPTGAQTTATAAHFDITFPAAMVPRVVGFAGTTLPVGTLIQARLKRPADSGFDYVPGAPNEVRVRGLPRAVRSAWLVLPAGLDSSLALRLSVFNDVDGSASIAAGAELLLGECWVSPGAEVRVSKEWGDDYEDATTTADSDELQPYVQRRTVRRIRTFTPEYRKEEEVFGDGADEVLDFEQLWACLDRGQQAVYIPRAATADGTYSEHLVNRTALLGAVSKAPGFKHLSGPLFGPTSMQVKEAPIPA